MAMMRRLIVVLAMAAALAGCAPGAIGEVDHSCHTNPWDSQGSGCEHHQLP
jgi:hypothetical protein